MDVKAVEQALGEEMIVGWEIIPTGSGMIVVTNWQLPNRERIEIHVRMVGERDDLYLVTDGGELYNLVFLQGLDLSKDEGGIKTITRIAESYGAQFVEGQLVKGANEGNLGQAIRRMLEALKEASFVLWKTVPTEKARLH